MTKIVFMSVYILVQCVGVFAQDLSKELYNLEHDLAVQGYDVVSYYSYKKPIKGNPEYMAEINGVTYLFASQENLERFKKNPASYEPEYGGWCAYAIGLDGSKVKIDPKTYKIIDGKLYLFYNFYLTNTLKKWNRNESELMRKADEHWLKLVSQHQ